MIVNDGFDPALIFPLNRSDDAFTIFIDLSNYLRRKSSNHFKVLMSKLTASIEKHSIIPYYHQLYTILYQAIEDGHYKSHDRLPSENELCKQYQISRNTAQKSIQLLVDQGIAYRSQGKGSFVTDTKITYGITASLSYSAEIIGLKKIPESNLLHAKSLNASTHIAKNLDIKRGEQVYSLERLRFVDKSPMALQTSFLPVYLVPGLIDLEFEEGSLFKTIKNNYGHEISSASELLKSVKCDAYESKLLNLNNGDAVFLLERVTKLTNGAVLEFVKTILRGDKSTFSIELSNFSNSRNT